MTRLGSTRLARLVFTAGSSAELGPTPVMLAAAGDKGGNGKTITTLGLASTFDGPALAVDVDRGMPNLHTMVSVGQPVDAVSGAPVREPSVQSHPTDSTVSAPPAPAGTDDNAFERWLRTAAGDERRAVADCLAGTGPDAATLLRVVDGVVVASPLCAPASRDAAKTAAVTRAFGTPVAGCVIFRSRVAPEVVSDLAGVSMLGIVPEESPPVLIRSTVRAVHRRIADKVSGKK